MALSMDGCTSLTSGYLQDAIAGWHDQYKLPQQVVNENSSYHANIKLEDEDTCYFDRFLDFNDPLEAHFFAGNGKFLEGGFVDSPERCIDCSRGAYVSKEPETKRIAYPFDLVKRGGIDGHITLEDINNQVLMPPKRPLKHPVGNQEYSFSSGGFSTSGKAIVALAKIHTHGRGTITVIRTKS